jgi:hypothetical protein
VGIATLGSAPGVALYLTTYQMSLKLCDKWMPGTSSHPVTHLVCGFIAEAVSCVFWVPVDVVKERLQAQPPTLAGRYKGSIDGVRTVIRNEKFSGLYRGYLSTLASFGPFSAVYFMIFEALKKYFLCGTNGSFSQVLLCAALANAAASVITNPLDLVKTRLQVQRSVLTVAGTPLVSKSFSFSYNGMVNGLGDIVRREGMSGLWRGSIARVLFATPNAALTMALFDMFQQRVTTKL